MTKPHPPLSVRLDAALAEALRRHCEQSGQTRSQAVQESIAQYLVDRTAPTLGSLAEELLPPIAARAPRRKSSSRQKRFREYVREKRRR